MIEAATRREWPLAGEWPSLRSGEWRLALEVPRSARSRERRERPIPHEAAIRREWRRKGNL
jgi:hypothetical protein